MNASEKSTILRRTAPCFLVRNVAASLDYYHNELGFSRPPMRSSPAIAMPARDGFIFILVQVDRDQAITQSFAWRPFSSVEDMDAALIDGINSGWPRRYLVPFGRFCGRIDASRCTLSEADTVRRVIGSYVT